MLEAYSTNLTLLTNSFVPFNSVSLEKGCTATLPGTTTIQLNKKGVYAVTYVMDALASTAGNITVQMLKNGVLQPETRKSILAVTTTGTTIVIDTLVQVPENNTDCCCTSPTTIQFQNLGVGVGSADVSVVVTKLC